MRSFVLIQNSQNKSRNIFIIIVFTIFIVFISIAIYYPTLYGLKKLTGNTAVYDNPTKYSMPTTRIICNNNHFVAYIARSEEEITDGLSVFDYLKHNEAMIFVFNHPDKYYFWMKGMKFPIDIVWFDENGKVVDVVENLSPDSYPQSFYPKDNALYVVEFNSGVYKNIKINIGEVCNFEFNKLK